MDDWPDLVTTALLGTGRRPLPADLPASWGGDPPTATAAADPAVRLLDLAARHRAAVRAGPSRTADPTASDPTASDPAAAAPPSDRSPCPTAAEQLLGDLLVRPNPELINVWLGCAHRAGVGVPARSWTRLARLAAHSTGYDRQRLGRALGARGRWFLRQNPEWRRLAADAEPVDPAGPGRGRDRPPPGPEAIRGKPQLLFDHPDPWPDDVVAAAFAVVGTAALGRKAREFAARCGARLPTRLYRSVAAAAEYYLSAPDATPAQRRLIKESFVIVEQAAFARMSIEGAFDADPDRSEPRRVEIGSV